MCHHLTQGNDIGTFFVSISANLISDVIFLLLFFLLAWLIYYFTKRRKLFKFFSIEDPKRLNVYLSRLFIKPGGAIGITGQPASYQGISIVYNEAMAANRFRENFNYLSPSFSDKPGLLSKILLSDVQVQTIVSVANTTEIDYTTSLITLGSPTYNLVSREAQNNSHSQVQFANNGGTINITGLQPMNNLTYGFIQRVHDQNTNKNVFYAAGLSELGTVGAANFLATNWGLLYKKYKGDKNFIIVLNFNQININYWSIVVEKTW